MKINFENCMKRKCEQCRNNKNCLKEEEKKYEMDKANGGRVHKKCETKRT